MAAMFLAVTGCQGKSAHTTYAPADLPASFSQRPASMQRHFTKPQFARLSPSRAAAPRMLPEPIECVPFARKVSGIKLYGNAHQWWDRAGSSYARGKKPQSGSVLVLSKTDRLKYGHLAVVQRVLSERQIEVTHVNWGRDWDTRRKIYEHMRVVDVSPNNDWSKLRFWSPEEGGFGRVYAASGFVYNQRPDPQLALASPDNYR